MSHRIYVVDVFAEKRYSGNPLAVIVGDDVMSNEDMQLLAAEMNYSETTFLTPVPEQDGGYRVRIFTPVREIAFAGHPILGTAAVLREHLRSDASAPLTLNLLVGQINVSFEASVAQGDTVWFRAPPATLGPICAREEMAAALGISPVEIAATSPVQQVSASTAAMIVPVCSLDALRCSRLDLARYEGLAAMGHPPLIGACASDEPRDSCRCSSRTSSFLPDNRRPFKAEPDCKAQAMR